MTQPDPHRMAGKVGHLVVFLRRPANQAQFSTQLAAQLAP
jgi:hypothetical protein